MKLPLLLASLLHLTTAHAGDPAAIMGGQGNAPYAAFIEKNGSVNALNLPPTGLTYRVAMNAHGESLVGGTSGVNAYAGLVAPNGKVTSIPGLIAPGEIYFVSINESGMGMIGGGHQSSNTPFAALVSPTGVATPIAGLPGSGLIYGVAIEKTGAGIIGGIGPLPSAYAALISADGTLTQIAGLPATGGIFWVAVNDSGEKLMGGQDNTSVYAAFVSPTGSLSPITGLPAGLLYSVDINDSGTGIIGGASAGLPYAALIAPDGTTTTLLGLPRATGIIYNVALNESETGLIAGFSAAGPYGAFVTPRGIVRPLKGLPTIPGGFLDGAALHSSGVAIVGGTSAGAPFAALVAPNGTLTYLDGLPTQGEINSIAIASLDPFVPRAIGPYDSLGNTQFLLSNALTGHSIFHRNSYSCAASDCCSEPQDAYSFWVAAVGNYVRQTGKHAIPTYTNKIAGALLGLDYYCNPGVVFGAGLAYAYNDVDYSRNFGHAIIHQESAVLYATFNRSIYINAALWGGLYQVSQTRNSPLSISSKSKPNGWNLNPHLELSKAFLLTNGCCYAFEPFVMFDWANNWSSDHHENGSSGFNIALGERHASILRSEAGIRLYETLQCDWGTLILQEKGSFVNRTSCKPGTHRTAFIGSASGFDVETLSRRGQNHGVIELHLEYLPASAKETYASLDYQGEFGSSFQSHAVTLSIGSDF